MVNIIGLDKLLKKLDRIAGNKAVMKGIEKGALRVEAAAKEKCPVDEGFLRASIQYKPDAGNLSATIGSNVEYAAYVEFGSGVHATKGGGRTTPWAFKGSDGKWHTTTGQRAQPFLYPALVSNIDKIKADIIEAIRNEIGGA